MNSPKWKIEAASTALAWPEPHAVDEMVEVADAARGDHRDRHRIGDGAREFDVEADLRPVAIHRGQENFASPEFRDFARVIDRVDAGRTAPAVGEDFPARALARLAGAFGVDRDDDALAAEFLRRHAHELPVGDRGRIDRGLVGAGEQQLSYVLGRPDAAAHGQRHEADFRRAADDVEQDAAILVARRDVEKAEFVRARLVVGDRALHGISGVAQIDEVDALDDAAVLHVEAGNDAGLEHYSAAVGRAGSLM